MFNQKSMDVAGSASLAECKPDPEEMIQYSRKRKGEIASALNHFRELSKLNVDIRHDHEESILRTIGELTVDIWQQDEKIEYWLEQANK